MNSKLQNGFLANYILMFIISTMIGMLAIILTGFASDVISKTLVKNQYTAERLMQSDYSNIDTSSVVENGGGIQIIDSSYKVVFSTGLDTIKRESLTLGEFTEFLINSKKTGVPFSYSIAYNSNEHFWLIVTFPTSIRIDFQVVHNKDYPSVDKNAVIGLIIAVSLLYFLLLAICTIIYSKITSVSIVSPLRKLCNSAARLKDGDYSTRVNLNLKNEFGELELIFNEMAAQIEKEMRLRKQSEESRKKLILDISHDLKNPLASIMGYAELCQSKQDITEEDKDAYIKIILDNSARVNNLITDLFELSKIESSEYILSKSTVDICEYMRKTLGGFIAGFDEHEFEYDFDIPEKEIQVSIDERQLDRVFQNLAANAVKYNAKGTKITVDLAEKDKAIEIRFKDNGIGINGEAAKDIFLPFVRVDSSRNSQTGGTGLGLAIVEKVVKAHGGSITLKTKEGSGCEFNIILPKI